MLAQSVASGDRGGKTCRERLGFADVSRMYSTVVAQSVCPARLWMTRVVEVALVGEKRRYRIDCRLSRD
jgi:hypothetical protein